jgi:hypothetical protein
MNRVQNTYIFVRVGDIEHSLAHVLKRQTEAFTPVRGYQNKPVKFIQKRGNSGLCGRYVEWAVGDT